jgi:hypothetical protein
LRRGGDSGGRGQRRGGAAGHQLGRQEQELYRTVGVLDPLDQQRGRLRAELVVREAHRTQRRVQPVDERHVVEPDDRDVLRAAQAELVQRAVAADREHVVGGDDGGEVARGREQLPAAARALLQGVGGGIADLGPGHRQAVRGHARLEAAQPGVAGRRVLRAGDVPDPGVPKGGQVGHRGPLTLLVVDRDGGERVVGRGPVHQHHRHVAPGRLGQDRAARGRGAEHQAVHMPGPHLVEDQPFLGRVGVGVADEGHVAVLGQPVLDAPDDRREQGVVEVGDQHADGLRPAGAQAARHRVGPVAEPAGGVAHPPRGLLADQPPGSWVERARGGGRVHARGGGHVPQGGRPVVAAHHAHRLSGGSAGSDVGVPSCW